MVGASVVVRAGVVVRNGVVVGAGVAVWGHRAGVVVGAGVVVRAVAVLQEATKPDLKSLPSDLNSTIANPV